MTAHKASVPDLPQRVLLIGIDGVRTDIVNRVELPHLDRLRSQGGFREMTIDTEDISISGPMWSTILTGHTRSTHGVDNNETLPATRLPDIFSQLLDQGALAMPVALASWPPLTSRAGCGPIINPQKVRCYAEPAVREDIAEYQVGDENVMHAAVRYLGFPEVDGAFVYFGLVDEVGHAYGLGDEYEKALQQVDSQIGEVIRALDKRADRDQWLVMVTTDHGQTESGSHGGSSSAECSVWVICNDTNALSWIHKPSDIAPAISWAYKTQSHEKAAPKMMHEIGQT